MKSVNNEKGYALLMVLMLILLFTVLGIGLLAMNMNAAKQFNMKEEQVQARHQAEMGVLHYEAILKDKVATSTSVALTCNDIESLLGVSKKLETGKYKVVGANGTGVSCVEIEENKQLEISIKSIGTINEKTKRELEATFYALNEGGVLEESEESNSTIIPPLKIPENAKVLESLYLNKHATIEEEEFKSNLIINTFFKGGAGNKTNLKVSNNFYIKGNDSMFSIDLHNHTCIGVGGNFAALNSIDWGSSKAEMIVRGDAYFPQNVSNWHKNQVEVYIFGDLYISKSYNFLTSDIDKKNKKTASKEDAKIFVGGKVYHYDSNNMYKEINNPFFELSPSMESIANKLTCAVPEMAKENAGIPSWLLQDAINVDYQ